MKRFIIPGALVLIGLHPSTQENIIAHEPDDCTARQAFAECPMKPDLQCSAQDITGVSFEEVVVMDGCDGPTDTATFKGRLKYNVDRGTCFDLSMFVPPEPLGSVGDDNKGGGPLTGKCDRFTFACGGPPIDLDVDGDLQRVYQGTGDRIGDRAAGAYLEEQIEVTAQCMPKNGKFEVPFCFGWEGNADSLLIVDGAEDRSPGFGTDPKCTCGSITVPEVCMVSFADMNLAKGGECNPDGKITDMVIPGESILLPDGIDFECEIFSDIEDGPEPEVLPYKKGDDVKIAFDGYDISEDTTYTVKIRSKDDTAERRKLGITSGPSCEAKFEFKMKPCCPDFTIGYPSLTPNPGICNADGTFFDIPILDFPTEGFTAKYSYIQQGSSKKGNDEPLEGRIAVADLVPASVLGYGGELARSSLYPGQTTLEVKVFKQKQSKNGSEGDVETLRSGGGGGPRPVCKRDFKFYPDCNCKDAYGEPDDNLCRPRPRAARRLGDADDKKPPTPPTDLICCPTRMVCDVPDEYNPKACGDPHMTGFLGQKFDFTGEDGGWYALIADENMNINMRVTSPVADLPEITYITGLSILTTDADGFGHSIVIEVKDPHNLDSSCPAGVSPCLADGSLRVVLDGEEALLAPGTVSLSHDVEVSAANLPGACRSFGFEKYWEAKKLENARHNRRLGESLSMGEWILGDPTTTNMKECTDYVARAEVEEGGLFAHQSEHASFQIVTPKATIRLSHGRLHQLAMRDPTDQFDLPDHLTWQMNMAVDHSEVRRDAKGVLGETFVPTRDANGEAIMSGMEAIRGTQEDYRVGGALGMDFVQDGHF